MIEDFSSRRMKNGVLIDKHTSDLHCLDQHGGVIGIQFADFKRHWEVRVSLVPLHLNMRQEQPHLKKTKKKKKKKQTAELEEKEMKSVGKKAGWMFLNRISHATHSWGATMWTLLQQLRHNGKYHTWLTLGTAMYLPVQCHRVTCAHAGLQGFRNSSWCSDWLAIALKQAHQAWRRQQRSAFGILKSRVRYQVESRLWLALCDWRFKHFCPTPFLQTRYRTIAVFSLIAKGGSTPHWLLSLTASSLNQFIWRKTLLLNSFTVWLEYFCLLLFGRTWYILQCFSFVRVQLQLPTALQSPMVRVNFEVYCCCQSALER